MQVTSLKQSKVDGYDNIIAVPQPDVTLPNSTLIKIVIKIDGEDSFVNARLWTPLGMNVSDSTALGKYPLLVTGYWGPNS